MKTDNKILFPVALMMIALGFYSCYDDKMEWGHNYGNVTTAEIPLSLAENLSNYDFIKAYAQKHVPHMTIGLGIDAGLYITDAKYRQTADENFQLFTPGNEMKHASVVNSRGEYNFDRIDAFFAAVPEDIAIYGHNYIWHTQQQASYLNSLIAPEIIPGQAGENLLDNGGFEEGTTGWNSWGSAKESVEATGEDKLEGTNSLKVVVGSSGANLWDVQIESPEVTLIPGRQYEIAFWVKSDIPGGVRISFGDDNPMGNRYPWHAAEGEFVATTSSWKEVVYNSSTIYSATGDPFVAVGDKMKFLIDLGKFPDATYYIDNVRVIDLDAEAGDVNFVQNGGFETGDLTNWSATNPGDGITVIDSEKNAGSYSAQLIASATSANEWDVQLQTDNILVTTGTTYTLSFHIKSDIAGQGRVSFPGNSNEWPWMDWQGTGAGAHFITAGGNWEYISVDFTPEVNDAAVGVKLSFDLGKLPGVTYWLDDVKLVEKDNSSSGAPVFKAGPIIIEKPAEEKAAIILAAMEDWIKTMAEHCKHRVKSWDVLNEAIGDGGSLRGIGFVPSETGAQEFYWGQYIGKDYGVKAFQFARRYGNPDDKLYINDYGLETSPVKLDAFLEYVAYIDATNGSPIVDGLGTQMHVHIAQIKKEGVDNMFKKMAATGKLVRITELDVQTGTATPTFEQLEQQAQVYRMIIDSYKENVPAAQQSGITVWTLTDNKREHEYWLPDDAPCLFDADYGRKYAYKNFCDGVAGYDISTDFNGDDWKEVYKEEE
jgi:GH35 family endo-1,4-beta-xylanase